MNTGGNEECIIAYLSLVVIKPNYGLALGCCYVVLVKSCHQSKDADGIFCLGKRYRQQMLPRKKMPKATFSQSYLCMKKTN